MTIEEIMIRFETGIKAECELSIARVRLSLRNDALLTKLFDDREAQYRETFLAGACQGAKVWRELDLMIDAEISK